MELESREQMIVDTRARLRQTRAEIIDSLKLIRAQQSPLSDGAFPRSAIMRALIGRNGGRMLGGAAIALAIMRPGLLLLAARAVRLAPWIPMMSNLLNRYMVRRNAAHD